MKLICFVLTVVCSVAMGYSNIASEGTAYQANTGWDGLAWRAIDGNIDGNYNSRSVTHTTSQGRYAWWKLQFITVYNIAEIRVWNRVDCCSSRLDGATVLIDGKEVGKIRGGGRVFRFPNLNKDGSSVTIKGGNSYLSLAEVEVFGKVKNLRNIAIEGYAHQSGVWNWATGLPLVAIDGNTNGEFYKLSVTHTKNAGHAAWWSLRFNRSRFIHYIVIYNRQDCCEDRIDGVYVTLDHFSKRITFSRQQRSYVLNFQRNAREIKIHRGRSYLSLAEVKVFGR